MFGTLHCDSQSNDIEYVERRSGPMFHEMGDHTAHHSACNKCRAKKVGALLLIAG